MDVTYINPFVISTIEIFKKMLNTEVKPGKVCLKNNTLHSYDVSGKIGLCGDAQGTICISFSKMMALKVASLLVGTELKIVGPEVADCIGEVANIIAGNAKEHFSQFNLSISLPKVVIGEDNHTASQSGIPTIVVPFESPIGEFAMEVSLS